ncbi:protein far1-related sequence 5-like [Stylonychia lemnae]|uniref:Protein far1-related sequence 5-like n=1 Tax=Stylonychia lemnae TaxID=5949 RepID=A0A078B595_STYLE|nr:protein far1-related sequence 5-like [Stylonychia lemnae]|eukprot:CDW88447.1 protein far1-related sequence 5-like [Stylonychia lemnae]
MQTSQGLFQAYPQQSSMIIKPHNMIPQVGEYDSLNNQISDLVLRQTQQQIQQQQLQQQHHPQVQQPMQLPLPTASDSGVSVMHDEFSDEENMNSCAHNIDGNFDFRDVELDNLELNKDEIRKMNDPKFAFNFSYYPRHFKNMHEALDVYNSNGYLNKIQFRLYEHQRSEPDMNGNCQTQFFSLSCYLRNQPKYDTKYYQYDQGRLPKVSNCNVNVRFVWNEMEQRFDRVEQFKYVHDHRLELDERCFLENYILRDIKHYVMDNIDIQVSEVIQKIYQQYQRRLRHLDVLNALKLIKGDVKLDIKQLANDIEAVQQKYPDTYIKLKTGTPVVVFFQSQDMLETYRLYRDVMLVSVSKKRKNKYGIFQIHMTGINNFGRAVVFATGFTNIKCKEAYQLIFKQFNQRCLDNDIQLPDVLITSLEQDILDAKQEVFLNSRHLISQHYLLLAAKEALNPYKKRMDFDFSVAQEFFEKIVIETDNERFNQLQQEILKMIGVLDPNLQTEIIRIFDNSEKWSIRSFDKLFTAGLHSNERAASVEGFFKTQHKYEHSMMDVIDLAKRLSMRECCLETNSKEAHSYFLHPVYIQMKRRFSPYALSLMLHQMIESYKYTAQDTRNESIFLIKTDKNQEFEVEKDIITKAIRCRCQFYYLNDMICSHSFCLMNALQIKHIRNFDYIKRWRDEINIDDPTTRDMQQKAKQQKKLQNFIDKLAEKNRNKKAKHKGGIVPVRRRKVEVDYYPSDDNDDIKMEDNDGTSADGRKTAKMYDLMVPGRMKLKAFTRQEEEKRKRMHQLTKYGSAQALEDIYDRLPNDGLQMPDLQDLNFYSDEDDSSDGAGDEVIEEFRRETLKDEEAKQIKLEQQRQKEAEREERRKQKKKSDKKKKKKKDRYRPQKKKKSKKKHSGSSSSGSTSGSEDSDNNSQSKKDRSKDGNTDEQVKPRKKTHIGGVPIVEVPQLTMKTRRNAKKDIDQIEEELQQEILYDKFAGTDNKKADQRKKNEDDTKTDEVFNF